MGQQKSKLSQFQHLHKITNQLCKIKQGKKEKYQVY